MNKITLAIILLLAGCHQPARETALGALRVTDFRGAELAFEQPPERVVCLIESALSGIFMLQARDRVIAVSSNVYQDPVAQEYARLDPRLARKELPAPGNWDFVSIEQVVALKPDLVIIWTSQAEAIARLEQFGIPVYGVMLRSFADVYKEISDFGVLFGRNERADSLIRFTKENLEALRSGMTPEAPVSVYFMWAQGILETSGTNSTVDELIQAAGARNACPLEPEHVTVNVERLADWNPGLILMWPNDLLDPEDVLANPLLKELDAVKNRRVYELPSAFDCDLWTLKMQYAAQLLASWAYPEQRAGWDEREERELMFKALYLSD